MKIKDVIWFTQIPISVPSACFGIVYGEDEFSQERKAFIASVSGQDEEGDTLDIVACGARIRIDQIKELYDYLNTTKEETCKDTSESK